MTADNITFEIKGLEPLLKRLEDASQEVKRKSGRAALRKAAAVISKAAKEKVRGHDDPETGRRIADNIGLRWNGKLYKRTGDLGFRIGVLKGAVLPKNNHGDTAKGTATPHWRLIEFGTIVSPAYPFLRPALENNIDLVTATFIREFKLGLDKVLAK